MQYYGLDLKFLSIAFLLYLLLIRIASENLLEIVLHCNTIDVNKHKLQINPTEPTCTHAINSRVIFVLNLNAQPYISLTHKILMCNFVVANEVYEYSCFSFILSIDAVFWLFISHMPTILN
uniref:Uncharacterized protein n=1 Tax=Glossina palpalis gambiensis TaxID=67801 RepID=A0A1B0B8N0_9MUSC